MKLVGTALAVTFALAIGASSALAQGFPNRPITWVVGFTPGGVSDNGARFVAKVFGDKLGQSVVIENKPGAGGIVAAEYVAAAKPDGYMILYASNGVMGTYKSLYKKLSYDPLTSFTLIHGFASSPLVLVVPEFSPFKSLQDIIDFGKKNPEKLTYASVGAGSSQHLTPELGGRIDLMFDYSIVVKPQIEGGKLRALASTGEQRLVSHPDVPTFAELGYPDVKFTAWATIVGPANMPQAVVDKLSSVFNETLKDPAVVKYHDDQGVTLMPDVGPEKLRGFIVSEQAKFKDIIERTGATAD
jgi:tripartite-type tricarboxylate transporter receptor subunit TctC